LAFRRGSVYTYGSIRDAWASTNRPKGQRIMLPKGVVITVGLILILMLCTVPIWNALALVNDANYVYWNGRGVPLFIISVCLGTMALYVVMVLLLFQYSDPDLLNTQTTTAIVNIFLKLLGLLLMLASMPLSRQAHVTFQNLMYNCEHSEMTHRTWELSQVLHQMRQKPDCLQHYSVEQCEGYEELYPYTDYLRALEENYFCSGFCYSPVPVMGAPTATAPLSTMLGSGPNSPPVWHTAPNTEYRNLRQGQPAVLLSKDADHQAGSEQHHERHERETAVKAFEFEHQNMTLSKSERVYPPTLFSQFNYKLSCEGMAARDVLNFAGEISWQCFYQGMFLVLMAVFVAFVKLLGLCTHANEREHEENEATTITQKKT